MPEELALSLQTAMVSNSPEVSKQAARAKLERFLSEKGAQETKISDAATVTSLKKQLLQAQDSAKKLENAAAVYETSNSMGMGSQRRSPNRYEVGELVSKVAQHRNHCTPRCY